MLTSNTLSKVGITFVVLFPFSAFAFSNSDLKNFDISLATGPTWTHASNGYIQVSPIETDTDLVLHTTKSAAYRLGVGYHFFTDQLANRQFFNDLFVQLNWYRNSATIQGVVWDQGSPNAENQSFRAPLTSSRLMLDVKPSLFTYQDISFYPIAGLGIAWNQISYTEEAIQTDWSTAQLSQATNKNLAYDLGFGFNAPLTKNLNASLEYISTHLGRVAPNSDSSGTQSVMSAPEFPVRSQSILLGLSWKF